MRYDNPRLQDILAGEYALGSLHGAARARFETLIRRNPQWQRRVVEWQECLAPLAQETPEIVPSPHILKALRQRLRPAETHSTWWNRLEFWRPFGAVAATLVMALAVYLSTELAQRPASAPLDPRYIAVLTDDTQQPAVVVTAYNNPFRLTVESTRAIAVQPGNVLRLWAVDRTTGHREPLADFTPDQAQRITVSDAKWQLVKNAVTLEVREEPLQLAAAPPTNPVLFSGPCINLKGPKTS